VSFLGTSGQNVDDVYKYSEREDSLGIMEALLNWGHLVPTAPDTLSSYPFSMDDPFLLDSAPHVLFTGNQASFQTSIVQGGPASLSSSSRPSVFWDLSGGLVSP
jgi:DNA polymerase delta subunit 2